MPLDDYSFCKKFGWIVDKFGVSWQLNLPKLKKCYKLPCFKFMHVAYVFIFLILQKQKWIN